MFLQGILSDINNGGIGNPNPLAPTIPETVYMCFQMTFAIITPALIAGAFAERMKFSAMLWFIGLWAIFVYAPVAHWVWGPDGISRPPIRRQGHFAARQGARLRRRHRRAHQRRRRRPDVAAIMLGKRHDTGPGHNMVLTFIGAALLWVGWFGFNAGSAVTAGMQAGMAMTVTQIATAVAALTWMFVEWAPGASRPSSASARAPSPASSPSLRLPASSARSARSRSASPAASSATSGATGLKHAFGYDDALDCFGVHGVGGIIGALLTGVFAINQYGGTPGLIEGNAGRCSTSSKASPSSSSTTRSSR